jgi:hypothetical protein
VRLWENSWAEFVPFLQFDPAIRRIVCTTNAIESVNSRIRKAVRARGHFPNEQAALKCVYMAVMSLDPTGTGRKRWTMRWKDALQAFDIAFDGRLSIGRRQLTVPKQCPGVAFAASSRNCARPERCWMRWSPAFAVSRSGCVHHVHAP